MTIIVQRGGGGRMRCDENIFSFFFFLGNKL